MRNNKNLSTLVIILLTILFLSTSVTATQYVFDRNVENPSEISKWIATFPESELRNINQVYITTQNNSELAGFFGFDYISYGRNNKADVVKNTKITLFVNNIYGKQNFYNTLWHELGHAKEAITYRRVNLSEEFANQYADEHTGEYIW